jgi:hypothetical protein
MSGEKYIGMDVHQATISVAVMDSQPIHCSRNPGIGSGRRSRTIPQIANYHGASHGRKVTPVLVLLGSSEPDHQDETLSSERNEFPTF